MAYKIIGFAAIFLCSCATAHKSGGSSTTQESTTEKSTADSSYQKETTIVERASGYGATKADSAEVQYYTADDDTTTATQTIHAGAITLEFTSTPRRPNGPGGKPVGRDTYIKAKKDSEQVTVPIDRKTTTKEVGGSNSQVTITSKKTNTDTWWQKQVVRLPAGVIFAIIIVVLIFIILIIKRFI